MLGVPMLSVQMPRLQMPITERIGQSDALSFLYSQQLLLANGVSLRRLIGIHLPQISRQV